MHNQLKALSLRPEPAISEQLEEFQRVEEIAVLRGPVIDIGAANSLFSKEQRPRLFRWLRCLGLSTVLHAALFICSLLLVNNCGSNQLRDLPGDAVPVELVLGLPNSKMRAPKAVEQSPETEQPQATKIQEALPQLPKLIATDEAEPPPDSVAPMPTEKPTPEAKNTPVQADEKKDGVRLTKEELERRAEREQRERAKSDQEGQHKKDAPDQPRAKDKLPENPFGPSALDELGDDRLPEGSVDGTVLDANSGYGAKVGNHMRKFWHLPDLKSYDPGVKCSVLVQVAPNGRVLDFRIRTSSGDPDFDAQAQAAIQEADPFPAFDASGPVTLELRFDPHNVR